MEHKEIKKTILISLYKYRDEMDEKLKSTMRQLAAIPQEELLKPGKSGISLQEILDGYKSEADKVDSIIVWVNKNI